MLEPARLDSAEGHERIGWLPVKLLELLETLQDGVLILDRDCNVLYANTVLRKDFGPPDGKKCHEYFHDRKKPCDWCRSREVFEGRMVRWEGFFPRVGKHFDLLEAPLESSPGIPMKLVIFHDKTEQKRTERALLDSERFNRAIVTSMGEGLIVYDRDLRYRAWNRFLEEMTGLPAEEVIGRSALEMFPHLEEQGLDRLLRRALGGETVASDDFRYRIPQTGKNGWAAALYAPQVDAEGKIVGVVAIIREITAHKQAEVALRETHRRLTETLESITEAFFSLDRNFAVAFLNSAGERTLGKTRAQLLGKRLWEVFPEARGSRFHREYERALAEGTPAHFEEYYPPMGRWFEVHAYPSPVGLAVYFQDITERRNADEALRRSERELSIRNRISEIFLTAPEDEIYAEVLRVIQEATGSKFGFFGYISEDDGAIVSPSMTREVWSRCEVPEKSLIFPREKWGGIWGKALREGVTVCSNGPLRVPEGHIPLTRAICVPIHYKDKVIGVITVADKAEDYTPEDVALIEKIAGNIASILHATLQRDKQYLERRCAEEMLARLRRQVRSEAAFAGIVGQDPRMLELFQTIEEVALVDAPVIILGESGTGKELVATAIHAEGPREDKPFIAVNCGALPEDLLESELFGHVRGAFTGAIRDRKGRFELADGGTIFLDEVGDISPSIQVKLLRVLQEGTIERVGGESTRKIDVRVISATNKDLERLVASGKFREDLYYRLCVVPIRVPPLRDRRNDIPLLVEHIRRRLAKTAGGREVTVSEPAMEVLMAHNWPGNVRELENAIRYACVKSRSGVLEPRHLPPSVQAAAERAEPAAIRGRKPKLTLEAVQRALEEARGNKREAARMLGVSRGTLYNLLEKHRRI